MLLKNKGIVNNKIIEKEKQEDKLRKTKAKYEEKTARKHAED